MQNLMTKGNPPEDPAGSHDVRWERVPVGYGRG